MNLGDEIKHQKSEMIFTQMKFGNFVIEWSGELNVQ